MIELLESSLTGHPPRLVFFVGRVRHRPGGVSRRELLLRLECVLPEDCGNELGLHIKGDGLVSRCSPGGVAQSAGILQGDRILALGETDTGGLSQLQLRQLFLEAPPPVLVLGTEFSSEEPPVWKMIRAQAAAQPDDRLVAAPSQDPGWPAAAPRAASAAVGKGFLLENPLTSVSKALLAAGSAASFPQDRAARAADASDEWNTTPPASRTVQGRQMARAIAQAPPGSLVQILLSRDSGTRMISVRIGQKGLGAELHTKHNETCVRRLAPSGPALAAGLAQGDRFIAVSIDTTPPSMQTEAPPFVSDSRESDYRKTFDVSPRSAPEMTPRTTASDSSLLLL